MQNNQELDKLLQKHRALFLDELGKLGGVKVKLHVDTTTHPKFCKARAVSLALQKKVEAALDKLEAQSQIFGLGSTFCTHHQARWYLQNLWRLQPDSKQSSQDRCLFSPQDRCVVCCANRW